MSGCTKADRNRKSASNIAYKNANRAEVNRQKRIASAKAQSVPKNMKVPRGTARALRRAAWISAGKQVSFANFK